MLTGPSLSTLALVVASIVTTGPPGCPVLIRAGVPATLVAATHGGGGAGRVEREGGGQVRGSVWEGRTGPSAHSFEPRATRKPDTSGGRRGEV